MEIQHRNRRSFAPVWLREGLANPHTHVQYLLEMFEVVVGLGIIGGCGFFLPDAWAWQNITFVAFFLLVFAIAVRYRPVTAYSAGLLAAVCYSLLLWQHYGSLNLFAFPVTYVEPFVLFFSSVAMSNLLHAQRQRMITAERLSAHVDEELREATQHYQTALAINKVLESQVVGQTVSIAIISDKLANLRKFNGDDRYRAILDVAVQAIEAQSCTLYVLRDGQMRFCVSQPEKKGQQYAQTLNLTDPLISKVFLQRQVCSVHDMLVEGGGIVPQTLAVMAGPLIDPGGQVVGIVTVDTMPRLKFNQTVVRLFRSILSIASMTLQPAPPPAQTGGTEHQQEHEDEEDTLTLKAIEDEEDTLTLKAIESKLYKKLVRKSTSVGFFR
jgi:hypothetical protein